MFKEANALEDLTVLPNQRNVLKRAKALASHALSRSRWVWQRWEF
jgi:hypothetical protein